MKDAQAKNIYLKDYQAPNFLIDTIYLDVSLHEEESIVVSRLNIRRNPDAVNQKAALLLHGQELTLLELRLDGKELTDTDYELNAESLTINNVKDVFELESKISIKPQENTSLEGLYKSSNKFCTQCEAEGFRKITWFLDRPDVLSSFTTRIEADKGLYPVLLSNGNKIDSGDCSESDKAGRHWVVWQDPFLKPAYLFALVAGNLFSVDDSFTTCSGREVALQVFVEEKDLDKCDFALRSLKKAMKWDEDVYGREYDLNIFMIVAVDDFNMGAMENKGLNIFNSSCVLAKPETSTDFSFQRIEAIVAHEYFHNWSGNRVTCRDWFQLSLKEGFTVYRDSEFSADMGSRAVKRIDDVNFLRTVQFAEDAGPMAHSVRPESYMEISNFYTVTIYEKGAEVVRMIANLLGPELFRKGTDLYFEKFDGMAVTTEDFVATMEEVSGIDLTQFRRWYSQAGTPVLSVKGSYDEQAKTYTLSVEQSCPETPGQSHKDNFHIPFAVALLDENGNELALRLEGEESGVDKEGAALSSKVLTVHEGAQDFIFAGIKVKPIPSLLRSFSAPVKMQFDYSRDELMFLMSHDSDGFVRWEAAQQLSLQIINELMAQRQKGEPLVLDQRLIYAMKKVLDAALNDNSVDRAMLSRLLVLPSEAYIAELAVEIDSDAIHEVREFVRKQLALGLQDAFAEVYEAMQSDAAYVVEADAIAQRALKNTVLNYLVLLGDEKIESCFRQYQQADNMTDQSAALRALLSGTGTQAEALKNQAFTGFYIKWKHEPLVIEQWLSMQAGVSIKDNLAEVIKLTEHESFDIKNPNKVRSVIGAFCHQNLVGFHHESGSGYKFLADNVITLNELNPQIASRLLTPLTRWRKQQPQRQVLMQAQLKRILELDNLSKDVYEVVSKSLG
ncbi:aminopeptidase N [Haliea sp. AH-315-K21]|uniref:Aminopeptidase N n=1 Tax=SAR86 cluster bacterium TaxID=2030880 RepID=A0A2A5C8T1_9GAMM|nr:aminopeptidase N [Haliea sp. AH-315-K21]PCJ39985.1 MAG: aminopeptidase N [SAR86 cluster bacterium]